MAFWTVTPSDQVEVENGTEELLQYDLFFYFSAADFLSSRQF